MHFTDLLFIFTTLLLIFHYFLDFHSFLNFDLFITAIIFQVILPKNSIVKFVDLSNFVVYYTIKFFPDFYLLIYSLIIFLNYLFTITRYSFQIPMFEFSTIIILLINLEHLFNLISHFMNFL